MLISSNSKGDALKWLNIIDDISNTDVDFWKYIQNHVSDNDVLLETDILKRLNEHFVLNNIPKIVKHLAMTTDVDDLPF